MKVGLVGCGDIVRRYHGLSLERLQSEGIISSTVCADMDLSAAEHVASMFHFKAAYQSTDEMIAKEKPDFLIVATPPAVTADLAIHLADYSIPMMLEKPPALTVEKAYRLRDSLAQHRIINQVAFNRHYMPAIAELRKLMEGREVLSLDSLMSRYQRLEDFFYVTAIHSIDLMRYLSCSDYESADIDYLEHGNGSADIFINAMFRNGIRSHMAFYVDSGMTTERVHVTARKASFIGYLPMWMTDDFPGRVERFVGNKRLDDITWPSDSHEYMVNGFYHEDRAFAEAVMNSTQPKESMEYAIQSLEVAECIRCRSRHYEGGRI